MNDFPLLNSLFDETDDRRPFSVSELNSAIKGEIERRFSEVWVEGEIVNFVAARSGHWYFTLHDASSQVKAACYRGSNSRIRFQPFDGLQVRVRGRLTLYEPKGEFQLLVESLEPVGEGALKVAFEQIKTKFAESGGKRIHASRSAGYDTAGQCRVRGFMPLGMTSWRECTTNPVVEFRLTQRRRGTDT